MLKFLSQEPVFSKLKAAIRNQNSFIYLAFCFDTVDV